MPVCVGKMIRRKKGYTFMTTCIFVFLKYELEIDTMDTGFNSVSP